MVDGWFKKLHLAPESYHSDLGQVRLLKPAVNKTLNSHIIMHTYVYVYRCIYSVHGALQLSTGGQIVTEVFACVLSVLDLNAFERQNKAEGLGMVSEEGSSEYGHTHTLRQTHRNTHTHTYTHTHTHTHRHARTQSEELTITCTQVYTYANKPVLLCL